MSPNVTQGYPRLPKVTQGYPRLPKVTQGHATYATYDTYTIIYK